MKQQHYDNIVRAAEYYGFRVQCKKTVEEIGEALAALGCAMQTSMMDEDWRDVKANLCEEIADVYNMLDQIVYLLDAEELVQDIAEGKMRREMRRIDRAMYAAAGDCAWLSEEALARAEALDVLNAVVDSIELPEE